MSRRRRRKYRPLEEDALPGSEPEVDIPEELATTPRQRLFSVFLAWIPLLLLSLGNGRNPWVPAVAAAIVGTLLIVNPPRSRLPLALIFCAGGLALLPLAAFLPVPAGLQWEWRQTLLNDHDMALPRSWSAQPWITFENWCTLVTVLLWGCWGVSYWQTCGDRMPVLRQLALGLSLLGGAALVFHFTGWQPATWGVGTSWDIGPYANRNHFSCLMAMNSVLCLATAYDLLRRKKASWMLYGLGVVPSFAVVIVNTSLGGLFAFSAGIVGWLALATLRGRSLQRLAVMGSILLVLTAAVVLFGQHLLREIFVREVSILDKVTESIRPALYANTLDLIAQNPLLGVGLGNFGAVFGMTHDLGESYVRYRHPESDWLWFLAEAGWPATLIALIGLGFFVSWMGLWKSNENSTQRRERRVRLAAGLAVLVSAGHGVVDVPNHTLTHALVVALLAGMALHHHRLTALPGQALQLPFRVAGVSLVGMASLWVATGLGYVTPMGESIWRRDLAAAKTLLKQGEVQAAAKAIDRVIRVAPLSWEAYFVRAETTLKLGGTNAAALADFARARVLEPFLANPCMVEAQLWLRYEPMLAVPAWRQALQREKTRDAGLYGQMLQATKAYPELRPAVRDLADRARFLLNYLQTTQPDEFEEALRELLNRFPQLEGLDSNDRKNLFRLWRERGDRAALVTALQSHEAWLLDGWTILAEELAAQGKPKEAFELAQRFIVITMNLTPDSGVKLAQLEREFLFYPSDPQRGFRLYVAQRDARQLDAALATLTKMAAQPTVPKHVNLELGKLHALRGDYVKAWEFTARYIHS